jgi:flagellin-specific chaperone FliS
LPKWKDSAKAKAESAAIREYLATNGYDKNEINSVNDHRSIILARKAMLYDQMISKASVAAKKVENLPRRTEKPGVTENRSLDKRSQAFQKLSRSGRVEDAAAAFATIL